MPTASQPAGFAEWGAATAHASRQRQVSRRYHFHLPGLAYAFTLVVIMLGAINGQNNVLFWLFGLGVAGLLISGFLSGAALMGLELEREVPAFATRLEELRIRYRLRSRNRLFPAFALTIEEVPDPRHGASPDWPRFTPKPVAYLARVPAGKGATAVGTALPARRGEMTFGGVRVWTTFPFGLTRKSVTFWQPARVLVLPRFPEVEPHVLNTLRRGGDEGRTPRRGRNGDEFYSHREYVPGDAMRRVSWKATARLGRVVVRELATTPAHRVWICAIAEGQSSECVVDAAAALARSALTSGLEVGLLSPEGKLLIPPSSGERHLKRCREVLAMMPDAAGSAPFHPSSGHGLIVASSRPAAVSPGWTWVSPDLLGVPPDVPVPRVTAPPTIMTSVRHALARLYRHARERMR